MTAPSANDRPSGLGDHVALGHDDALGERALVLLGEQRALRVERLVAGPARGDDDRVDDDGAAVLERAGAVAAEDHRELVGLDADAAQRPQVVHVHARRLHVHRHVPGGHLGVGALADHEGLQRVVGVRLSGVDGEHGGLLWGRRDTTVRWNTLAHRRPALGTTVEPSPPRRSATRIDAKPARRFRETRPDSAPTSFRDTDRPEIRTNVSRNATATATASTGGRHRRRAADGVRCRWRRGSR